MTGIMEIKNKVQSIEKLKTTLHPLLTRFYNRTNAVLSDSMPQPFGVINQKCEGIENELLEEIAKLLPQWTLTTEKLPEKPTRGLKYFSIYPIIVQQPQRERELVFATYNHLGVWATLGEWEIHPDSVIAWMPKVELVKLLPEGTK